MPHYDLTDRPMYDAERYTRATVAESPSLLYNNLTAGPSSLGYVHGSQAIVVPVERALSGDPSEKRPILTEGGNRTAYQVKIVTFGAETFFVLCTAEACTSSTTPAARFATPARSPARPPSSSRTAPRWQTSPAACVPAVPRTVAHSCASARPTAPCW